MPVTVNINSAQIAVDIRAASEKARGITSQQALADCNEYVPDDQDALVNSSNIQRYTARKARLVYSLR